MTTACLGLHLAEWLSNRLPQASAVEWADHVADLWWRCRVGDRRILQANLDLVLGGGPSNTAPMVRDAFRNFGRYLVEFFTIHRVPQPHVDVEGYEHLVGAQRAARGSILLSAHLGNWELAGVVLCRMGFQVSAVALPHRDSTSNRLFNRQRVRCGLDVIPVGRGATSQCLQRLREGRLVGLVGDWALGHDGVVVSLCGQPVRLPRGPAILSLRSQAPVVPLFLVREGVWRFRLLIEPPIWPAQQPKEEAMRHLMQTYAEALERLVKRFPSQWLLFHPLVRRR